MAASGRFKKALFCFRKSAVLDYVEAYQKDSRATIESLSGELSDCREELTQANAVNAELEAKLAECEEALRELNELAESLQAKIEEMTAQSPLPAEEAEETQPEPAPTAEIEDVVASVKSDVEEMSRRFGDKLSRFDKMLAVIRQHIVASRRPGERKK